MRKTPCPVAITLLATREGTTTDSANELTEWLRMGAQGQALHWRDQNTSLVATATGGQEVIRLVVKDLVSLTDLSDWLGTCPDRPGRLVFATCQTDIPLHRGMIVTHPGVFHADDVYAVAWIARYVMPEVDEITIVRTRDEAFLARAKADPAVYVIDVGGVYEPLQHNYDHHQVGAPVRANGIPYAAFGQVVGSTGEGVGFSRAELAYLDQALVQSIDAVDCGAVEGYQTLRGNPEVRISQRGVSGVVHGFNPSGGVEADYNRAFEQALAVASQDLDNAVDAAREATASRIRVGKAIEATTEAWVVLDQFEALAAEVAAEARPDLLYLVFPDEPSKTWRILQVPVKPGSHEGRKPLPEVWRGKRGVALDSVTGVRGGVFCHSNGFIAGHETREGAIAMARKAVGL